LIVQAPGWAVWGLATAPIIRLSRRFPLAWPLRLRALAAHVAACLTIAAAFNLAYTAAVHAFPFRPGKTETLLRELWNHLVSWAPFLLMAYASLVGIGRARTRSSRPPAGAPSSSRSPARWRASRTSRAAAGTRSGGELGASAA
jgi:hypothetical protein